MPLGQHGHDDLLGLLLFASGRALSGDIGYGIFGNHTHLGWASRGIAHNTVVVNQDQTNPDQLFRILLNLYRREGISQQELARKLLVGRSNMSMLLPQLEKRGLIERRGDGKDRRVLRLFLTEEGKDITEKAMVVQTALIDTVMGGTEEARCLEMADHMEKIVGILLAQDSADEE